MRVLLFCGVLLLAGSSLYAQEKRVLHPNGSVQFVYNEKDGLLDGPFASYTEDGQLTVSGSFKQNQKSGTWQSWDKKGVLRIKRWYRSNSDFDVLGHWDASGCEVNPAIFNELVVPTGCYYLVGHYYNPLYMQRHWKKLMPSGINNDFFSTSFLNFLQAKVLSGEILAFSDVRFINHVSKETAAAALSNIPQSISVQEQNQMFRDATCMERKIQGIGLVYNDNGVEKTYWLGVYSIASIKNIPADIQPIIIKLTSGVYVGNMELTTRKATGFKPTAVNAEEGLHVLLSEIEFEGQAWIFQLDKKLSKQPVISLNDPKVKHVETIRPL